MDDWHSPGQVAQWADPCPIASCFPSPIGPYWPHANHWPLILYLSASTNCGIAIGLLLAYGLLNHLTHFCQGLSAAQFCPILWCHSHSGSVTPVLTQSRVHHSISCSIWPVGSLLRVSHHQHQPSPAILVIGQFSPNWFAITWGSIELHTPANAPGQLINWCNWSRLLGPLLGLNLLTNNS